MANIYQIKLPSGTVYDIVDAGARELISALGSPLKYKGSTTTVLSDGSTTNPITINGESYTAVAGDVVTYTPSGTGARELEFVFDGTYWQEFGSTGSLKALAFKDSASGNFTPSGTINVNSASGSGTSYTPTGAISVNESSGSGTAYTPEGSIAVNASSGSGTSYTPEGAIAVNAASGSGTSYTPEGAIAVNASSGSGTSYTPEGSVSAPTISVKTAGGTTNVTPFGSAGSLPSLTMSVSNGNLTFSFDQGTLPSGGTAVACKTSDPAYEATAPSFTGTEKKLAFTGTEKKLAFSGTQKKLAFSGDEKKLAFTGTQGNVTVS